ncbi:MAG: caspase family protein [Rhodocyclaceae bacterium]|nr:caspase family protein [Rhodocyclaceae bacterium]
MSKRALCIGINDYPGTDSDLAGCVNDAADWRDALTARGFEVASLIDDAADKAAMVAAIRGLIDGASGGDSLVITYSGHGTWVPDDSGDEADGRDEALCPHDIAEGQALLDDELHELLRLRPAGARIVLISDSCHSGSVSRGREEDLDPGLPRARFLPPAAWMQRLPTGLSARPPMLWSGLARAGGDVLMAGCMDTEYSWDTRFGGRANGAFTYYALKTLGQLGADATYRDWHAAIGNYLPSTRLPQHPQILGSRSTRNFRVLS